MLPEQLPSGIWAVGSEFSSREEVEQWSCSASSACAWTFRRPNMPDSEALTALRWLSNRGSYLAVHGRRDLAALTPTQAHISGLHSVVQTEVGRAIPFSGHHLCSTHSLAEVSGAAQQMDGVFFGPILTTPSKVGFVETHGFGELAKACALGIPVIAIGGFQTPKDVAHCAELGAHGVAVLRAARKPSLLAELSQAFAEARP